MYVPLRFFFSSRRRHTRCLSDWSSDVCSSDLTSVSIFSSTVAICVRSRVSCGSRRGPAACALLEKLSRSEERRVGRGGRSGWRQRDEKKKRASERGGTCEVRSDQMTCSSST